jgi:hypothetical protein
MSKAALTFMQLSDGWQMEGTASLINSVPGTGGARALRSTGCMGGIAEGQVEWVLQPLSGESSKHGASLSKVG